MATTSNKLETCEVCGNNEAKYTCPKCEVRTCCLACVNIHKKELDCDGIRDKTKFVPLKSFTDLDLLSDYRLLEQVDRSIDGYKRNPEKKFTCHIKLPVHLYKLRAAALHRKVSLLFMPQNFSRHKENTTFLKWKTNELFWRIEWLFPQAESTKWISKRVLENTRLSVLIEKVLNPTYLLENNSDIVELHERTILAEKLQYYTAAGLNNIKVLLKAEKMKKSNCRFHDLDLTLTLKENLENKTIIEFPTLYVITKNHSDMYETIDTDEELNDSQYASHGASKRKRINCKRNLGTETKKHRSEPVNYFFNDFSESDDERIDKHEKKSSCDFDIPHYEKLVRM